MARFSVLTLAVCTAVALAGGPPDPGLKEKTARWVVHNSTYGVLATRSVHLNGTSFGNVQSFADGGVVDSSGTPYFYVSDLDVSQQDIAADPEVSFVVSEAELGICAAKGWDPEDPRCAKVVLSGTMVEVTEDEEKDKFKSALFARHPAMKYWPTSHNWKVKKINVQRAWLLDEFGGADDLNTTAYFATSPF